MGGRRIQLGDLSVNYSVTGTGPPLVLLHGAGADIEAWEDMLTELSEHATVYCYDQRGFGATVRPSMPALSIDVWTSDLLAFLDAFDLPAATLVGWSLGGAVALNFACEHPQRCSALVAIGTVGPENKPRDMSGFKARKRLADNGASAREMVDATFDFTLKAFSEWSRQQNPRSIDKVREMLIRNNPSDYAETVAAIAGGRVYGDKLDAYLARTLIICGTEDGRNPPSMSQAMHRCDDPKYAS